MTRDDIIRMAIKCQLVTTGNRDGIYMDALEDFANLVAAAEREACARLCEAYMAEGIGREMAQTIRARG